MLFFKNANTFDAHAIDQYEEVNFESKGFWLKHQSKWHFNQNKTDHHDIEVFDVKDKWNHSDIFQNTFFFSNMDRIVLNYIDF